MRICLEILAKAPQFVLTGRIIHFLNDALRVLVKSLSFGEGDRVPARHFQGALAIIRLGLGGD